MKKIFIVLVPVCMLVCGILFFDTFQNTSYADSKTIKPEASDKKPHQPSNSNDEGLKASFSDHKISLTPMSGEKPVINLDDWNLMLVGPQNKLIDNYSFEKKKTNNEKDMDARIFDNWVDMYTDAQSAGIDIFITSAYRSIDLQSKLFQNKIDSHMANGNSKDQATVLAKEYLTVPGYSEHHTGLALDIVTPSYQNLNAGFSDTDAGKWLKDNAHKYGFILRYPKEKEDITDIKFEPWHFRYVGTEHAEYIYTNDLCLEEYLKLV